MDLQEIHITRFITRHFSYSHNTTRRGALLPQIHISFFLSGLWCPSVVGACDFINTNAQRDRDWIILISTFTESERHCKRNSCSLVPTLLFLQNESMQSVWRDLQVIHHLWKLFNIELFTNHLK